SFYMDWRVIWRRPRMGKPDWSPEI
ncbi:MAG: hypothetical protein JWL77_5876, partial [Chthonomonadaceae bacterium]|nr:hypothetical protein [Chthonomonadaceae bacterium]